MTITVELDDEWQHDPAFHITADQRVMWDHVKRGATPENASVAAGISDSWRQSGDFAAYITRIHAHNACRFEKKIFSDIINDGKIPTGVQFMLKCFCGWHDKWGDDGFAQSVTIELNRVDGTKAEKPDA